MHKREKAFITFYDAQTTTLKVCSVAKASIQSSIDRALVLTVAPDQPDENVTDEHARQLGGLAIHILAIGLDGITGYDKSRVCQHVAAPFLPPDVLARAAVIVLNDYSIDGGRVCDQFIGSSVVI